EDKSFKGLQFITETKEPSMIEKSVSSTKTTDLSNLAGQKNPAMKTRIHRSYPVGISLYRSITGSDS
ncbi:hypothetical protein, partial [Staphylococcus aureus]|uniref:hypothetical protein n=1 Tax=Staphylococcus aureus TaxID=1280 RepID=UPI0038B23961